LERAGERSVKFLTNWLVNYDRREKNASSRLAIRLSPFDQSTWNLRFFSAVWEAQAGSGDHLQVGKLQPRRPQFRQKN
jgi:hypothetical protein